MCGSEGYPKISSCSIRSATSLQRKSVVMDFKKVRCIWSIVPSPIIHRTIGQIRSMFCSVNVTNWDHLEYTNSQKVQGTYIGRGGRGGLVRSPTTYILLHGFARVNFGDKINVSWIK